MNDSSTTSKFDNEPPVVLPASRIKAFFRSMCLMIPAALLGLVGVLLIRDANLTPNAVSNRVADYAVVLLALPIGLAAIMLAIRSLQWLSVSCWPAAVGFEIDTQAIKLKLGWWHAASYDTSRMSTAYLFELDPDEIDEQVEAYLPQEHQRLYFLPRMLHPEAPEPINRTLLRFCNASESELAHTLGPLIECWRELDRAGHDEV